MNSAPIILMVQDNFVRNVIKKCMEKTDILINKIRKLQGIIADKDKEIEHLNRSLRLYKEALQMEKRKNREQIEESHLF